MLLMIDNYDSFTYNLTQYFQELGAQVSVKRNDEISLQQIAELTPKSLVISPGPCTPQEAGISVDAIIEFAHSFPVLGVCLGHQCIGEAFGAKVVRARQVMHGKTSMVHHNNQGVFNGLPNPLEVTRYHSLVVSPLDLPDCLQVTAWTETETGEFDEIMGLRHKVLDIEGVQFHPESVLTDKGHDLLQNFVVRSK